MRLYEALRQALPQYYIIPLTEDNFAAFCEVFDSNQDFLIESYGKLVDEEGIFGAIAQLPYDGFNPTDKYLAVICQNGKTIAAVDMLANLPKKGELYLSFVVVHEDLKERGLGTIIVEGIINAVRLVGFTQINLNSFEATAAFWERQGFIQSGTNVEFISFYRSLQ